MNVAAAQPPAPLPPPAWRASLKSTWQAWLPVIDPHVITVLVIVAIVLSVPGVELTVLAGLDIKGCNVAASGVIVSITDLRRPGTDQVCSIVVTFTAHDIVSRNGTCLFPLDSGSCHFNVGDETEFFHKHQDPGADLCFKTESGTYASTRATLTAGIILLSLCVTCALLAAGLSILACLFPYERPSLWY